MKRVAVFTFYLFGNLLLAQDTVTMINGRKIEGVISSENAKTVVVEMHGLKLSLNRKEIKKIERMNPEQREEAIEAVRAPRPHEEAYYPESVRPLFREVQNLGRQKSDWSKATQKAEDLYRQLKQTQTEIVRLNRIVRMAKKQLDEFTTNPNDSVLANNKRIENHNRLVKQTNRTIEQTKRAMNRSQQLKKKIEEAYAVVEKEREQYARTARRVGKNWLLFSNAMPDEPTPEWFGELYQQIDQHPVAFELSIESNQPPFVLKEEGARNYSLPKDQGGHYFLTATLNQVQIENFLIDTGATICVLPESVGMAAGARTMGPPVKTQVADGRTVKVIPAVLDEMLIYGQSFQDVAVGLMPDEGPYQIPNLLGMNIISKIPMQLTPQGLVMTIRPDKEE